MFYYSSPTVGATVGYSKSEVSYRESQALALLRIEIFSPPGGAPQPFTLTVNTEDGTASLCLSILILL